MKAAAKTADASWLWTLAYGYHEDPTPTHGYEPTREAAMAAFAKSWRAGVFRNSSKTGRKIEARAALEFVRFVP